MVLATGRHTCCICTLALPSEDLASLMKAVWVVVRGPEAGELSTTVAIWTGPLGRQAACIRQAGQFIQENAALATAAHLPVHEQQSECNDGAFFLTEQT